MVFILILRYLFFFSWFWSAVWPNHVRLWGSPKTLPHLGRTCFSTFSRIQTLTLLCSCWLPALLIAPQIMAIDYLFESFPLLNWEILSKPSQKGEYVCVERQWEVWSAKRSENSLQRLGGRLIPAFSPGIDLVTWLIALSWHAAPLWAPLTRTPCQMPAL